MYLHKTQAFILICLLTGLIACTGNQQKQKKNTQQKPTIEVSKKDNQKEIVFFGNSLTAGYGVDPEQAYPALIQDRLDSLGYSYEVINAGVSGETTASGDSRIEWVLDQQDVSVFFLELGGNDGLRGIPPSETEKNLKSMIEKVRAQEPEAKIILAGMMTPPNMGEEYSNKFKAVFPKVAMEKDVKLLPFLLEGVAGEQDFNLEDGIHPNPEGHQILAKNVWEVLKPLLEK